MKRIRGMRALTPWGMGCSVAYGAIMLVVPSVWGAPLELEAKIPLREARGRIDHWAVDVARQRLFVAELGNDTVGVVDLANHAVLRTLTGLHEAQGLGMNRPPIPCTRPTPATASYNFFRGAELDGVGRIV